ncbi:MAG: PilZ domain-containing protein [Deltaproteobacteria bacterium]|nr:PilZ domain-containing protein [Deltaproteobacteria bacterium]
MPVVQQERRASARIDKVFRVLISTDELGDQWYIARNISSTGMFVEMADPLPLKTKVIVRFRLPHDDAAICAMARVQNHYYLQYSDGDGLRALAGVGLRLLRFVADAGAQPPEHRLH